MSERTAIVICQGWPTGDGGLGIAMRSSLLDYGRAFERIVYVCMTEDPLPSEVARSFPAVRFHRLPIKRRSYVARFLASLRTHLPACVMQMHDVELHDEVQAIVYEECARAARAWCIVENIGPSILISQLRRAFPQLTIVYRSHDVSELAFHPFTLQGSLPVRLAWRWEIARIHRLEQRTFQVVDRFWTITHDDAAEYRRLHGRSCHGVLEVRIDAERYAAVEAGSFDRIIYLGSTDLRKQRGLQIFLEQCWPELLRRFPQLEFWMGGAGTERFDGYAPRVRGIGRVERDEEFLGTGRVLINPQDAGTGIKLKSLVALAAGKVLVSTANGVMGIRGGVSGTHFLASSSAQEMVEHIAFAYERREQAELLARHGRELVCENYSLSVCSEARARQLAALFAPEAQANGPRVEEPCC